MADSQARKNKEVDPRHNEDINNPEIIKAIIKNLKLNFRGNNPEADAALQDSIDALEELLKHADGGNPLTQRRPKSSRKWRN